MAAVSVKRSIERFTKVRNFLIPHSIIFLNPKFLGFLFLRKLAQHGEQNVKNQTSENLRS